MAATKDAYRSLNCSGIRWIFLLAKRSLPTIIITPIINRFQMLNLSQQNSIVFPIIFQPREGGFTQILLGVFEKMFVCGFQHRTANFQQSCPELYHSPMHYGGGGQNHPQSHKYFCSHESLPVDSGNQVCEHH